MVKITTADMARYSATADVAMPDTATNARTGVTCDCRVDDAAQGTRVPEMPFYLRVRSWSIKMPTGQDVQIGDRLTVPGKGVYSVLSVYEPISYPVIAQAHVIELYPATWSDDAGHTGTQYLPLQSNATVAFRHVASGKTQTLTAAVVIVPRSPDEHLLDKNVSIVMYEVIFDPTALVYADGVTNIAERDQMQWPQLGASKWVDLRRPIIHPPPLLYGSIHFDALD